ncbi:hypothetical protein PCANC_10851 [Puccinia coronata f. sp. avenae]|uniref:Uncharacterized protein n=1 Tax=Puccinia coronata f. sp. avenae TaxID=200324 RepID=A0A2N5SVR5_9BASI|nr:hypothetical protein PCASD_18501 [Puccinia coronata f. sp. avenae]PLW18715.1 hypothetical protein PCANC_12570 [Puccinia coronata f. sp. avenae]PLW43645.1 hypothetical protein PCANC_10851 [Puccinia coronata f. sp. avenae]
MPAFPSDYYLFTNQTDPITDQLISSAYYYDHDRPNSPPTPENLNQLEPLNTLRKEGIFHRETASDLRQPEPLQQENCNNLIQIPRRDVDPTAFEERASWPSPLQGVESLDHLPSAPENQEDFYQDLDHLGILDYLRSDQEFQVDSEQHFDHSGLDWLEFQTDRHKAGAENHNRSVTDEILAAYQHHHDSQHATILLSCSSCGVTKPQNELSRIWPCCHPHCNTCINTLINASCNDPPPPQMVCFFCSQHVDGFDPPSAFLSGQSSQFDKFQVTRFSSLGNQKTFIGADLDSIDSANLRSPPSDQSGLGTGSFSSLWSPIPNSDGAGKLSSVWMKEDSSMQFKGAPGRSCPWPIIRVDNISWSLTVAEIIAWLPGGLEYLPPHELCPLPIHILCTPTDGKTLNHCFIEMRDLTAAHFIVRHRHGSKIGIRPCSVVLTSSAELHSKILGIPENEKSHDMMKTVRLILKLCAPHQATSAIKKPERPFYHLMSILSHCEHMSEGGTKAEDSGQLDVIEKWTHIHQIAIESLFGWKIDKTDSMNILHYMVDVAIASSLIDKPTLFRFLSQF